MSRQRETPRGAPRTVPSSSGKRNTVLIATLTERPFFSFVEATSRFLGSYEKALASFSSFWNVIRLPVTRSVGLKGQGGPGVSETRGGARDVIDRRHEASPRVTERPSATLRLRHPVPALPPFWLLAPAALAVRTLLGPRVASPTNGLFRLFKPPPTVCPERGSVLVTVVSGSRLFGPYHSRPASNCRDWWVVLGLDPLRSDWSEIGGWIRSLAGAPNVWCVRSASTDLQSAFGPKSPFLFPLALPGAGLRAPRWVLVASVALQMQ